MTIALSICAWIIAFLVGSFSAFYVPFQTVFSPVWVRCIRTVPQRAVDCAILYLVSGDPELLPEKIGMWFKAELDPNISFSFHPCSAWGCLPPPVFAKGARRDSVAAAWAEECRAGNGLTLPQAYRYVLLPNAYRVISRR